METLQLENAALRSKIAELEAELAATKQSLQRVGVNSQDKASLVSDPGTEAKEQPAVPKSPWAVVADRCQLNNDQIARYSRHLILHEVGVAAQASICQSRVLVVGAGGLGSSTALYLAAAGVGHLGIIDGDSVESSNLHRQIIHSEARLGLNKAVSAQQACLSLNSGITVEAFATHLTAALAKELFQRFDVVVDCTDNVASRYLVSDAAVLAGRPLVWGSAVGLEGQLTVFAHTAALPAPCDGSEQKQEPLQQPQPLAAASSCVRLLASADGSCPCYRCLFPVAPPANTVRSCSDAGVLGVLPGIIGCFQVSAHPLLPFFFSFVRYEQRVVRGVQALEVLQLLGGFGSPLVRRLLCFDASALTSRIVKLRPRNHGCAACGCRCCPPPQQQQQQQAAARVSWGTMMAEDYVPRFCSNPDGGCTGNSCSITNASVASSSSVAVPEITCSQLAACLPLPFHSAVANVDAAVTAAPSRFVLLDVRPRCQFAICSLRGSLSLPLQDISKHSPQQLHELLLSAVQGQQQPVLDHTCGNHPSTSASSSAAFPASVFVICRRGVASVTATRLLLQPPFSFPSVFNVTGGLRAWAQQIDPAFPNY